MNLSPRNRFQDFFEEKKYVVLKNHLYNYLLRKRAVEKNLQAERLGLILEVGSGISPVMTRTAQIVYTDISLLALRILRTDQRKGLYVVADGMCLPFKSSTFAHAVYSEVLEHLPDDSQALGEMSRVLKPSGELIVTFPHREAYFTNDDYFVNHFRRYELHDMVHHLQTVGLMPVSIQKVLGPLEKITMSFAVFCFSLIQRYKPMKSREAETSPYMKIIAFLFKWANLFYAGLAWLDARITPRSLAAVLLIRAKKR